MRGEDAGEDGRNIVRIYKALTCRAKLEYSWVAHHSPPVVDDSHRTTHNGTRVRGLGLPSPTPHLHDSLFKKRPGF
jgi:hypothetical protein